MDIAKKTALSAVKRLHGSKSRADACIVAANVIMMRDTERKPFGETSLFEVQSEWKLSNCAMKG